MFAVSVLNLNTMSLNILFLWQKKKKKYVYIYTNFLHCQGQANRTVSDATLPVTRRLQLTFLPLWSSDFFQLLIAMTRSLQHFAGRSPAVRFGGASTEGGSELQIEQHWLLSWHPCAASPLPLPMVRAAAGHALTGHLQRLFQVKHPSPQLLVTLPGSQEFAPVGSYWVAFIVSCRLDQPNNPLWLNLVQTHKGPACVCYSTSPSVIKTWHFSLFFSVLQGGLFATAWVWALFNVLDSRWRENWCPSLD